MEGSSKVREKRIIDSSQRTIARTIAADEASAFTRKQRILDKIMGGVLAVGTVASTLSFLVGLGLAFIEARPIPTDVAPLGEAVRRAAALRPSGFLMLGIVVLIATPLARIASAAIVFLWERDWLYTGITLLVLAVMIASLLLGRG
jgi:uncharacterized membrane protein